MRGKLINIENKWVIRYADISDDNQYHLYEINLHEDDYPPLSFTMQGSIFDNTDIEFIIEETVIGNRTRQLARFLPKKETWNSIHEKFAEHCRVSATNYESYDFSIWLEKNYMVPNRLAKI